LASKAKEKKERIFTHNEKSGILENKVLLPKNLYLFDKKMGHFKTGKNG
jgi:hypothetical protein